MALADLIARLEHDADARIAELTAKAEAEARSILAEASRVKETLRTTELGQRRAARQARLERELAEREPGRAAHHSTPGNASWPGSGALLVERRPKRAPFGGGASTTGIGGGAS